MWLDYLYLFLLLVNILFCLPMSDEHASFSRRNSMLPGDCPVITIDRATFGFEENIADYTLDPGFIRE